jgi:glycosyltransferase involved in cell wall biosynthesis
MKIAILTPEYITEASNWHGGLSNYLSRMSQGLKNRGHMVHVFTYSNLQEVVNQDGIILHRIKANDFLFMVVNKLTFGIFHDILQMLFIAFSFRKYCLPIFLQEKFDVIHSSSCQTPGLLLNSKKIGAPIVTRLSSITRLCQIVSRRRNKLDMYLLNLAEKRLAKKSDKIFAPSLLTKKNAPREFDREIDLIESPEYFTDWDESKMDFSVYNRYFKDKKYILFYGTLSHLKGSNFIAEIIYDFLNRFPDCYFVIIGKMVPLRKNILPIEHLLLKAEEHKDRVIYTNSLRHKLLFPIIKNARAVILPSMLDNFPNTLIESMSLGKIVIGTYDGGFDQIIEDGYNGFLVNYGDNKSLLKILDYICKAPAEELERIGENAEKTIHERLNFEEKIVELEKYYQQAIKDYKEKYG